MPHHVKIVLTTSPDVHGHPMVLLEAIGEIADQLTAAIDEIEDLFGQDCWDDIPGPQGKYDLARYLTTW